MEIKELRKRLSLDQNKRLTCAYNQFSSLLIELKTKELSDEIIIFINKGIDQINSTSISEKEARKLIKKTQSCSLNLIEKQHKLVAKNHYRNMWLAIGMGVFGVPIGVIIGTYSGNMSFIGVGIPLGMSIGIVYGSFMDKKAIEEGRVLEFEIK
jgi:hypothetical protein